VDRQPGRTFQTRDRWGHIRATNDRTAADNHSHRRSRIVVMGAGARRGTPGLPRSSIGTNGRSPEPVNCAIRGHKAGEQCFPSSRYIRPWSALGPVPQRSSTDIGGR